MSETNTVKLRMTLSGVDQVEFGLRKVVSGMSALRNAVVAAGVAIGAGQLVRLAKNAIEAADAAGKMSQKVGIAVEELTALQYAAKLSDVDVGTLQFGLKNLAEELNKAGKGSASFYDELVKVADKFAQMPDGIQKTTEAVRLFGRSGLEMIPLLNQGGDAIRSMAEEARLFGLVVGENFARNSEEFNDNLTRMRSMMEGALLQTMERVLPSLNAIVQGLVDWAKQSGAIQSAVNQASIIVMTFAEAALVAAQAWRAFTGVLEGKSLEEIGNDLLNLETRIEELRIQFENPISTENHKQAAKEISDEYQKLYKELSRQLMDREAQLLKAEDDRHEKTKEKILALPETEEQKNFLIELALKGHVKRKTQIEAAGLQARLRLQQEYADGVSGVFGNLAEIAKAFGKKGFAAYKAFATAQAIVDTYKSAIGAYSATVGIPYVGPVLAPIAAAAAVGAGIANIAKILSTNPTGYMAGGYTGSGPRNQVAGVVHRGEYVVDAPTVSRIGVANLEGLRAGAPSVNVGGAKVTNVIVSDESALRTLLKSKAGTDEIINIVRSNRMALGIA